MFDEPGDCIVCGAAHTSCRGVNDGNSSEVGKTRGVIVRQQAGSSWPMRVLASGEEIEAKPPTTTPTKRPMSPERARRIERRRAGGAQRPPGQSVTDD